MVSVPTSTSRSIGSIRAGKAADFAVLEDVPYELGVERLSRSW
jgi:imidazolonepropionase-like amidohydrolase